MSDTVLIYLEEYARLKEAEHLLECLKACGVEDWDGYEYAQEQFLDETE